MEEKKQSLWSRFKWWLWDIRRRHQRNRCYDAMEASGDAVFGMCCGQVGGDIYSENLAWHCMDCPYLRFQVKAGCNDDGE